MIYRKEVADVMFDTAQHIGACPSICLSGLYGLHIFPVAHDMFIAGQGFTSNEATPCNYKPMIKGLLHCSVPKYLSC